MYILQLIVLIVILMEISIILFLLYYEAVMSYLLARKSRIFGALSILLFIFLLMILFIFDDLKVKDTLEDVYIESFGLLFDLLLFGLLIGIYDYATANIGRAHV